MERLTKHEGEFTIMARVDHALQGVSATGIARASTDSHVCLCDEQVH